MKNKRGQFYLIAAIIIISVLAGFFLYQNYAKAKGGNIVIYDLGKELELETGNVYDFGTYNSADTEALIQDWVQKYYEYTKSQGTIEDWIFVYGSRNKLTALTFSTITEGNIDLIFDGGIPVTIEIKKEVPQRQDIEDIIEGKVKIKFNKIEYPFELGEGQNFFFVIKAGGSTTSN